MDFKKINDDLIEYISKNYEGYLKTFNIDQPFYTTEFLDFDKFKKKFICYIEFDTTNFPINNQFNDDCSQVANLFVNIFLAFREDTPENLNTKMLNATSAFFQMIKNKRAKNINTAEINRIDFFKYVEGSTNIVASKIVLEMNIEI